MCIWTRKTKTWSLNWAFMLNGNGRYLGLVAFYIIFPRKWEKSMLRLDHELKSFMHIKENRNFLILFYKVADHECKYDNCQRKSRSGCPGWCRRCWWISWCLIIATVAFCHCIAIFSITKADRRVLLKTWKKLAWFTNPDFFNALTPSWLSSMQGLPESGAHPLL